MEPSQTGLVPSYKGPQRASLLSRGDMEKTASVSQEAGSRQALSPPAPGSHSPRLQSHEGTASAVYKPPGLRHCAVVSQMAECTPKTPICSGCGVRPGPSRCGASCAARARAFWTGGMWQERTFPLPPLCFLLFFCPPLFSLCLCWCGKQAHDFARVPGRGHCTKCPRRSDPMSLTV